MPNMILPQYWRVTISRRWPEFFVEVAKATKTDDRDAAIRQAFPGVGVSLVMTTVVLVAGSSTVAFSDSRVHGIFATMGALTIGFALPGDLIILPAMISWFGPKK